MRAKRAKAAQKLNNAWLHLAQYPREAGNNVAQSIIMDAERRVLNGFGPVPQEDCDNLLAIEYKYLHAMGWQLVDPVKPQPEVHSCWYCGSH